MLLLIDSGLSIYRPANTKGNFAKEYKEVANRFSKVCKNYLGHEVMSQRDFINYCQEQPHKGDVLCLVYPLKSYKSFNDLAYSLVKMLRKFEVIVITLMPSIIGVDVDYRLANGGQYLDIDSFEGLLKLSRKEG